MVTQYHLFTGPWTPCKHCSQLSTDNNLQNWVSIWWTAFVFFFPQLSSQNHYENTLLHSNRILTLKKASFLQAFKVLPESMLFSVNTRTEFKRKNRQQKCCWNGCFKVGWQDAFLSFYPFFCPVVSSIIDK